MSLPKVGMYYEDVRRRVKGVQGKDPVIRKSLLNQVRLHEGEEAQKELERELSHINQKSSFLSGAGHKQSGIGEGKKLGDGRWIFKNGEWVSA
jgi:hypothetical protein